MLGFDKILIHDCSSPSASQQFEGRGADEINNSLTMAIDRIFNGPQSGLDLEKLCIIPGQQCWVIYIDAMVKHKARTLNLQKAKTVIGYGCRR